MWMGFLNYRVGFGEVSKTPMDRFIAYTSAERIACVRVGRYMLAWSW